MVKAGLTDRRINVVCLFWVCARTAWPMTMLLHEYCGIWRNAGTCREGRKVKKPR
jgi:hypothetical protein